MVKSCVVEAFKSEYYLDCKLSFHSMPAWEAPCTELGSAPRSPHGASPSPSEVSSASSPEPQNIRPSPLFRVLAMPPPDPIQPAGQDELERRLPGYRRIVIPRELTLIELLKQCSGVATDEEVLHIREAKLRVMAERVGLRRLHILAPCLRSLTLDGSAIASLRDLGIGLVHLRILSVTRCGLTSLDGIWGLSSLRELHAAHNRLQDLQALAALQKLHTLNLAHNPISDSSRIWMLAVCGALRKLTLEGSPASDEPDYRATVASALPLLVSLDDRPLHNDFDDDYEVYDDPGASSGSDDEGAPVTQDPKPPPPEPEPSTSKEDGNQESDRDDLEARLEKASLPSRRRPATTEACGTRPRHQLPPRPRTAVECSITAPARLEILNTLMDEQWRCSGSKLTSRAPVCGNLAQALRRPFTARRMRERATQESLIESGLEVISREIAEEIPRAPKQDDWERFKKETGIDIDIDFTKCRPRSGDATLAIERLERIERETAERLANPDQFREDYSSGAFGATNFDMWKVEDRPSLLNSNLTMGAMYRPIGDLAGQVNDLFSRIGLTTTPEESLPESLPESLTARTTDDDSLV